MFYSDLNPVGGYHFNSINFVNDFFIDKVNNYIKTQSLIKGTLDSPNSDDVRNSQIHWMTDEKYKDDLMPLYNDLTTKIRQVNNNQWKLVIDGWEPFQYTEYDESYKGYYDWHIDYLLKKPDEFISRKLSFSLGISDKDDYEGGDLVLKTAKDENIYKLDMGEIVIFPSWTLHKVTPVTKGKRRVIVGWGLGPVV